MGKILKKKQWKSVFVDEFITRLAEMHGESQFSETAHRVPHHAPVSA